MIKMEKRKTKKEIEERIKDIEKARADLNNWGNLSEAHFNEFNFKINELKWALGQD